MLAPGRLLLPRPLAERWPAVLARGGVGVARTGRRAVLRTRDAVLVLQVDDTAEGGTCSLELVTDTNWRRRLEAVFLGSGASLEDPDDMTPVVRFLYRASEAQWSALRADWLRQGAALDGPGPWATGAQPFPSGELRADGAVLPVETGPALAPDGAAAVYLDLLPRFGLRPGAALLALMQRTHDQLLRAGAAAIHGFAERPQGGT